MCWCAVKKLLTHSRFSQHRVIGNMSLTVYLEYWEILNLMLPCGTEAEALFDPPPQDRPPKWTALMTTGSMILRYGSRVSLPLSRNCWDNMNVQRLAGAVSSSAIHRVRASWSGTGWPVCNVACWLLLTKCADWNS